MSAQTTGEPEVIAVLRQDADGDPFGVIYSAARFRQIVDYIDRAIAQRDAAQAKLAAAEADTARLREMAATYGRAEMGADPERKQLLLRFAVSEMVLHRASSPMEVFAQSVDDCLRQFREWMYANIPRYRNDRRAQELATASADAERLNRAAIDAARTPTPPVEATNDDA